MWLPARKAQLVLGHRRAGKGWALEPGCALRAEAGAPLAGLGVQNGLSPSMSLMQHVLAEHTASASSDAKPLRAGLYRNPFPHQTDTP